jgi:hypothetical protein
VQGQVVHAGRRGLFDDVVGRGFMLLSPDGDPVSRLPPELKAFFASLGGLGVHVGPGAAVDDADGHYARWFGDHDAGVVLQRPDFHVFGTAPTIDGAAQLVAKLRDQLAS